MKKEQQTQRIRWKNLNLRTNAFNNAYQNLFVSSFQRWIRCFVVFLLLFLLRSCPFLSSPYSTITTTFSFPSCRSSLSAVFITHRRYGAHLHYTHIHSIVPALKKIWYRVSLVDSDRASLLLPLVTAPPFPVSTFSLSLPCFFRFFLLVTLSKFFSRIFGWSPQFWWMKEEKEKETYLLTMISRKTYLLIIYLSGYYIIMFIHSIIE